MSQWNVNKHNYRIVFTDFSKIKTWLKNNNNNNTFHIRKTVHSDGNLNGN